MIKWLTSFLLWCILSTTSSLGDIKGVEILSDTQGVDFGPYVQQVLHDIRQHWYTAVPPSAQMNDNLAIAFSIMKDGKVANMKLVQGSGDEPLDRAAWAGIVASSPFPPLPSDFKGSLLALRFHFYYNPPSGPAPLWDKGEVVGRTYRNASVGVELTPPPGLEFVGPPKLKGNAGTVPLLVAIRAAEPPTFLPGRKVMAYYSDALAYYPLGQHSTGAYLRKVVQENQNAGQGFQPLGDSSDQIFGGVVFARQDFESGAVSEVVLVKACDAQALVFIFAARDRDEVNKLIAATDLKVDQERSGCLSNTAASQDKPGGSSSSATGTSVGFSGQVVRDVQLPRVLSSPQPNYPQEARSVHAASTIVIGMVVGSDGQPRDVKVISGISAELDRAAVDAAERWRFQPGTKDGKPVSVEIAVEFDFRP